MPRMKVHQLVDPQEFREDEWLKIRTRVFGFFYFHPQKLGLRPTAVFQAKKNFWVACPLTLVFPQFSIFKGRAVKLRGSSLLGTNISSQRIFFLGFQSPWGWRYLTF